MLIEAGRDSLVPGGFIVPAAGFGICLQGADVVELRADRRGARRVRDEKVALFADVGVGARAGGFGASAEAVRESGFEHLGVQPGDLVGYRRHGVDGGQWEQLPGADLVHRRLVGTADSRRGQLGVAQRHLGGDVTHERHQRGQPDAPIDQAGTEGMPQLVRGDVQQLSVAAAQLGGGDRVEQALAQPE